MTLAGDKPSPLQLRAELEDMVLKDLLGPAGGPTEIVTERNVRGRYVLGLLAPKGQTALPDDDDELTQSGTDTEDGKAEAAPLKSATMLPSSIGLTFTVSKEAAAAGGACLLRQANRPCAPICKAKHSTRSRRSMTSYSTGWTRSWRNNRRHNFSRGLTV